SLAAAGRHFASTVADLRYIEGSYDRHLVREALGTRDITFRWGGWAPALTGAGLGMDVDAAALERVAMRRRQLLWPGAPGVLPVGFERQKIHDGERASLHHPVPHHPR